MSTEHRFQVHLRGIIDLLGNHLYSQSELFLRELLQNSVDAITARTALTPDFRGEIQLELESPPEKPPTLTVIDNGIGMTEAEIHAFLSTIGESSKRASHAGAQSGDFLGQFGIGMLAGFMVSDHIVVITRSAREGHAAIEWRGRLDGSYEVRVLDADLEPGTRVYLTARRGDESLFTAERVRELTEHYGSLLPHPIYLTDSRGRQLLNAAGAPWRREYSSERDRATALLDYGRRTLGENFLDAIPLVSQAGGVEGVAYVLPHAANLASRRAHRVYLKNMLLSEAADNLLPEWAFFVKAIVNVERLSPTASRESFCDDERLEATRMELGAVLRQYLGELPRRDPARFERFLAVHHLALKALAAEDDECYRTFIDWLPFETPQGRKSVRDLRMAGGVVRYVDDVGQFHQIAKIAAAQGAMLVNAGYAFEAELIARLPEAFPECEVERVDPASWTQDFEELTPDEQDQVETLLDAAESVLAPLSCRPEARRFRPAELPTLFATDAESRFYRSVEHARDTADPLFGGLLASMASQRASAPLSVLCLNYDNSLVRRLARLENRGALCRCIEIVYVQSLLLAQQPLTSREIGIMNQGLTGLVDALLVAQERRVVNEYELDIERLSVEAAGLPDGPAKLALLDEAVRLADLANDHDKAYALRMSLLWCASCAGRSDQLLVAFAWCCACFDRNPQRYDLHDFLWKYKWTVRASLKFSEIRLDQIDQLLDDMERRFREFGSTMHAVWRLRRTAALATGRAALARDAHAAQLKIPRDNLSDCLACVESGLIHYYSEMNEWTAATSTAESMFRRRLRCGHQPHGALAAVLLPMFRLGRGEEARQYQIKGYRLVRRDLGFLEEWSEHLRFLTLMGDSEPARLLLQRHWTQARGAVAQDARFWFCAAALMYAERLRRDGITAIKIRLPAGVGIPRSRAGVEVAALVEHFRATARDLADRFDARNGNDYFNRGVDSDLAMLD